MNNPGFPFSTPTLAMEFPSRLDLLSRPRLLVLIPVDADYSAATRRLWELANACGGHIQLLGLCKDAGQEPALRRELVIIASLLRDGKVSADWNVEYGTNWVEVVKRNRQAGDLIVCFAEQHMGLLHRPLSQILESNVKAPVYILSGFTSQTSKSNKLAQILAWLGSLAFIVGFGILQANVVQLSVGWVQSTLLVLSIIPEFWLIWVWNSLFE